MNSLTKRTIVGSRNAIQDGDLFSFAPVMLDKDQKPSLIDNGIYCWVEGSSAPKTRHSNELIAKKEAERLALLNPGKTVHIMKHKFESINQVTASGVVWS